MDNIDCVKKKIEWIIKKSQVPEDPIHSKKYFGVAAQIKT